MCCWRSTARLPSPQAAAAAGQHEKQQLRSVVGLIKCRHADRVDTASAPVLTCALTTCACKPGSRRRLSGLRRRCAARGGVRRCCDSNPPARLHCVEVQAPVAAADALLVHLKLGVRRGLSCAARHARRRSLPRRLRVRPQRRHTAAVGHHGLYSEALQEDLREG